LAIKYCRKNERETKIERWKERTVDRKRNKKTGISEIDIRKNEREVERETKKLKQL
jgi:hypothetical protein